MQEVQSEYTRRGTMVTHVLWGTHLQTQRSDEPVSKSRFRVTPGVPILTGTTYSRLQNKNMRM